MSEQLTLPNPVNPEELQQEASNQLQSEQEIEAAKKELFIQAGRLNEENPDRPDLVQQELGLAPSKLHEMGYTRLSDLLEDAAPTYAEYKAKKEATDKEIARIERAEKQQREFDASVESNKAYAEKRKARQAATENEELVASLTTNELAGVSNTELSQITGKSYGEVLREGKHAVVKEAQERVAERAEKAAADKVRVIPTDTAAEQRTSEYAQMLKEHDKAILAAQLEAQEAKQDQDANQEDPSEVIPLGSDVADTPRIVTREDLEVADTGDDVSVPDADRDQGTDVETENNTENEKTGRLQRMKQYLNSFQAKVKGVILDGTLPNAVSEAGQKSYEKWISLDRRDKAKVIGGAAVAAVGAYTAVWLGNKYGLSTGGSGKQSLEVTPDVLDNRPRGGGFLDAINDAAQNRTNEILNTGGDMPWERAKELYGSGATPRLQHAVDALQQQGVDAGWVGDYIQIDGHSDTEYVWNKLAQVLAEEDIRKYLEETTK